MLRVRPNPLFLAFAGLATCCGPRPEDPPRPFRSAATDQLFSAPPGPPIPPPPGPYVPDPTQEGHGAWPREVVRRLERRAADGDGSAAWELCLYYSAILHRASAIRPWHERATDLRHPEAQRWMAEEIRKGASFSRYGTTPQAAVRQLLADACTKSGSACNDLAEAYEEGYFGAADLAQARAYQERGAELGYRISWEKLALLLRDGLGGPVDLERAYFWASLEARCVDPRSVSGEETWELREGLAAELDLDALTRQWVAVDSYIADYEAGKRDIYFGPFGKPHSDVADRKEGARFAAAKERAHRERLRKERAPQFSRLPNNGLHQTGRGGVAFASRRRPVIEARPAGEPECWADVR